MLKAIRQWGLQVVIVILLVACGGGGNDSNEQPGPTLQGKADFAITHFSSLMGESRLDYALVPAKEAVINTADLTSTEIQVQLEYADKTIQITPSAVSLAQQSVSFTAPGNVETGQLSLVTANSSSRKINYRVIEQNTPRLVDVQPVAVKPGDLVTVTGVSLPEIPLNLVFDLQHPAVSINVTPVNNSFTFTVPSNLATGEFYLQLAQFQSNRLYLSVKKDIVVEVDLPVNLTAEVGNISIVSGGEEYTLDSGLSAVIPIENNSPVIIHAFAEKDDESSVLYSSVILPGAAGPIIFDAKSSALAWTMMGLLTTGNLSDADYSDLYTQLQSHAKVELLADYIADLQDQNSGQWLNLNDAALILKFRAVAEDLLQVGAAKSAARVSQKTTVSNSFITISQDPENPEIYLDDYDYALLSFGKHLNNGSVSIVNDTQMYLSVEARSVEDNSIINGYQHNQDVFYADSKTLIGPKGWGLLSVANSKEIELEGEDAHIEIITGASMGETDQYQLHRKLRAKLLLDGVFVPLTNSFLNVLIDLNVPKPTLRHSIYDVMNSIYGSSFITDLAGYYESDQYSLSGMINVFFINPLSSSVAGCWSVPVREGCSKLITGLSFVLERYGPLKNAKFPDLMALLLTELKIKLLGKAVALSTGLGAIVEAFDTGETLIYAVADGVTIAESLIDLATNPNEINVEVEFALDIESVTPGCIGVDPMDNYNFVLDIAGEGFMAVGGLVPSVYLGIGYAETALVSVSAFNNGTLLSAADNPHNFISQGSTAYNLFVEYDEDVFAQFNGLIQFIDINDDVVYLDSIQPAQGNIGSEVTLKGCGWIPLDDIDVHFKSASGEVLASDIVSSSIDEIKVKVPDQAVTGMVYVTAGNKITTKEFFEIKTFSLKELEEKTVLPGDVLSLAGKGLDETSAVYFTDHTENSIQAVINGAIANSLNATVPDGLTPGLIKVYAQRLDGKMTNEIELVIIPSLVTATPDETVFEDTIQLTLSQAENFAIYYRIEEAPYAIYTGPITLNASEALYAYFSIYAFARIEVDGVNYDSAETEFRYTPCQPGEHVENGACVGTAPPVSGSQSCPLTYDLSVDPDGDHAFMIYTADKDKDGFFEDYTHCIYFNSTGHLTLESFYIDTVKHGLQTIYYDSGIVRYEEPFENGLLNGVRKTYYESGKLEFETDYLNGKKHGQEKEYYYANKTVVYCSLYENGVYVGSCGSISYRAGYELPFTE